jgi:hypothetical protein
MTLDAAKKYKPHKIATEPSQPEVVGVAGLVVWPL